MLRDPLKYQVARITIDRPLFHWAQLFDSILPGFTRGTDIDGCFHHRGHHLFIESKPVGASISRTQGKILETLAQKRKNHVLLIGLRNAVDDAFSPQWTIAAWTWISRYQWRDPMYTVVGGEAEFREVMLAWIRRIDRYEDKLRRRYQLIPPKLSAFQDEILSGT